MNFQQGSKYIQADRCMISRITWIHPIQSIDMRYPPGKLPQPGPGPALGRLGWPHLIPITQQAGLSEPARLWVYPWVGLGQFAGLG